MKRRPAAHHRAPTFGRKCPIRRRLSRSSGISALAVLGLALSVGTASGAELRFSTTAPGAIVATGNTLGLSKDLNLNGPGVRDSIGTFLTLGSGADDMPANPANPWPAGTTYDWHQNGSAAVLALPSEYEILYAELIWGGSYEYVEDVTANLNDAVTLTMGNDSVAVSPANATKVTLSETAASGFAVRYYMRSADVTSFVAAHGAGTYATKGVPATQIESINSLNAAGWTLVVAYRNASEPIRNLSVFVGGSFVDEDAQQDYVVSGFCAPPTGPVNGTVAFSTIEGDANLVGDQLLIAPSIAGPFQNLSGPNNPVNNFFCSQLNDSTGALDTSGTFGSANQNAGAGTNVSGGRQGWDVTTVALSSAAGQLSNGQQSAVMRTITTGDSFVPVLAAFQIDVNAPDLGAGSTIDTSASVVSVGDSLAVTLTLDNQGDAPASNIVLDMTLPSGLALAAFTTDGAAGDAQGNAVTAASLATGVDEGALAPGAVRTVVLDLDVVGPPPMTNYLFFPNWDYEFVSCTGDPPISESYSNFALVSYLDQGTSGAGGGGTGGAGGAGGGVTAGSGGSSVSSTASAATSGSGAGGASNGGTGGAGPSGSGGSEPSGAGGGDGDGGDEASGCGCALPGAAPSAPATGFAAFGVLFAAVAAARRRRHARR